MPRSQMFFLPDPTRPLNMMSSACRNFSFALLSIFAGAVIVSGIIFTTVRAQQSGSIPHGSENQTDTSSGTVSSTNSNNYAASIAALTAGKPGHFHTFQHNYKSGEPSKYTEKLQSSSSVFKPSSFSLFSGYEKPSPAYYNYANKHQMPISDSYLSHLYSPYMMPISNYYTGSSSSSTPNTASPYQYTAYAHNQPSASTTKPTSALLSIRDRLLKAASSSRVNSTVPKTDGETEKLTKQLQTALAYHQLMALQQYQALVSSRGGASAYDGYGGYPGMSALYQQYYNPQAETGSDSPVTASASGLAADSPTMEPGSTAAESTKSTSTEQPTPEQLQQAIAATIAYRQQLAMLSSQLGSRGSYGGAGSASSLYGSTGSGYGFPSSASSLFGGGSGGYSSSYAGSGFSSLYGGSSMPSSTGAGGMLSSLTGGLSALAGAGSGTGLGLLSGLGMLFG